MLPSLQNEFHLFPRQQCHINEVVTERREETLKLSTNHHVVKNESGVLLKTRKAVASLETELSFHGPYVFSDSAMMVYTAIINISKNTEKSVVSLYC